MDIVTLQDKRFEVFISSSEISKRVQELAREIDNTRFPDATLYLGILRGSFLFMADLVRAMKRDFPTEFISLRSYHGMQSGELVIGEQDFNPTDYKTIFIIEDIIDTGKTLSAYKSHLLNQGVQDVKIVSLLRKPAAIVEHVDVDFIGFDIPNDFVLGYGMDYNGYGRTLPHIYRHVSDIE